MMPLNKKTILITGATDGLGKKVAEQAAAAGATVLLHGRNPQKGRELQDELKQKCRNEKLFYYNADFSSLEAVRQMSGQVCAAHPQLHILINNAAIGGGPRGSHQPEYSADGFELRFAVNYLAGALLTHNLLPLLLASAPARIVNVASIAQMPLDISDLNMKKSYDSYGAYARSKLAQITWGFELAEKVKDKGITVNSLHPATLMNTNMVQEFFGSASTSVEEGAAVVAQVAFSPETEGQTGLYFNRMRTARAHSQAYDRSFRRQFWLLTRELVDPYTIDCGGKGELGVDWLV